jgi:hypothetical protein
VKDQWFFEQVFGPIATMATKSTVGRATSKAVVVAVQSLSIHREFIVIDTRELVSRRKRVLAQYFTGSGTISGSSTLSYYIRMRGGYRQIRHPLKEALRAGKGGGLTMSAPAYITKAGKFHIRLVTPTSMPSFLSRTGWRILSLPPLNAATTSATL